MLVLSRAKGQGIVIDGPCIIMVTEISANRVRLGFVAQPEVTILREELIDQKSSEPRPNGRRPPLI
jgi:carbon storage regulator CsrA